MSYISKVQLGRIGIQINPQMFEMLLERRALLLLFDGLDEVATLDERRRLVEEIEAFAYHYPGNRILITSRPVGYELAPFSSHRFSRAQIQEFDDEQIHTFLEAWYKHVLRLSPLPFDDQQELEALYKTLKENSRLHTLAANPLLLTVITALHRYERLPDRRILVYDRCADLLLDTWAKLKGTDARWKDMKLGKEDQYACVAYLGFILHERSQEKEEGEALSSDVPTRFMLREIEHFLNSRKLLSQVAEQRAEAKRFLELMQVEAGLIVERGTDENGESLYGFVHRTFQEYFAAADVYENYQQEEDSSIISEFLKKYLHDPHWREVILLLFGKLKRKPATVQLNQLLDNKSIRSKYVDILQQDLFFTCDCLSEEIAINNELAETIMCRLSVLVKESPFPTQRNKALEAFASLMRTRLYRNLALKELNTMISEDTILDIPTKIHNAHISKNLEEQQFASQILSKLMKRSNLTVEQTILIAQNLYWICRDVEVRQQSVQKLFDLARQPSLTVEQILLVAKALINPYVSDIFNDRPVSLQVHSPDMLANILKVPPFEFYDLATTEVAFHPQDNLLVLQMFLTLVRRDNLSLEQISAITQAYNHYTFPPSFFDLSYEEQKEITQELFSSLQKFRKDHSKLSMAKAVLAALMLCQISQVQSKEYHQAAQILSDLIHEPDLPFEQVISIIQRFYMYRSKEEDYSDVMKAQQQAIQKIWQLSERTDLSLDQRLQAVSIPLTINKANYRDRVQAVQTILTLLPKEEAERYLKKRWQPIDANFNRVEIRSIWGEYSPKSQLIDANFNRAEIANIPYIAELAKHEVLPTEVREQMYSILDDMTPQFGNVIESET